MAIGQFNLLPPIDIATARLATARLNGDQDAYLARPQVLESHSCSLRQRISSLARVVRGEHHRVKISKNDMVPILEPDDLMDLKGRFALMWKVVDGHDKAAFKAGEVTHTRKRAAIITEEDLVKALPHMNPATPQGYLNRVLYILATGAFMRDQENEEEVYKIKDIACKNWQGGIKEVGRDPPNKTIRATPSLPMGLGVFEKAKLCPVAAIDVMLSKHPKESPSQRLFLKPLPSVVAESEPSCHYVHLFNLDGKLLQQLMVGGPQHQTEPPPPPQDLAAGPRAGMRQRHRLRTKAPLPPQDLAAGPWAGMRQRHRLRTEAPLPPQDLAAGPGGWYPGHVASWGPAPNTWHSTWHPAITAHAPGAPPGCQAPQGGNWAPPIDTGIALGFEEFRATATATTREATVTCCSEQTSMPMSSGLKALTAAGSGARASPTTTEDIVTAFLSLGAGNPSHGVLNSCNVFASIAGAHKKHAMQQAMAAWGQLPKATKDLYNQAAKHINDVQGRVRKATRVASKK
ncbi:hypothetical protein V8C86DRAFT_3035674 [Haematococcus lacustris]